MSLFGPAEGMSCLLLQGVEGPACSLVPLAGPSIATSTGLKWNLSECPLSEAAILPHSACWLWHRVVHVLTAHMLCGRHAEHLKMQFGGLISTSNTLVSETVHVQSDLPLLWTTEFDDKP
jgi:Thiamin pyrophosphokinase, vitamin B1 binding domain